MGPQGVKASWISEGLEEVSGRTLQATAKVHTELADTKDASCETTLGMKYLEEEAKKLAQMEQTLTDTNMNLEKAEKEVKKLKEMETHTKQMMPAFQQQQTALKTTKTWNDTWPRHRYLEGNRNANKWPRGVLHINRMNGTVQWREVSNNGRRKIKDLINLNEKKPEH